MTTQERFLQEIARLHTLARQSINESAERWLNIALRYDYISFPLKERADELLRLRNEIIHFNANHVITEKNVAEASEVADIVANTHFPLFVLQSVAEEFEN